MSSNHAKSNGNVRLLLSEEDPRFQRVPSPKDRFPAQNIEAEMACLGSMIVEPFVIDEVVDLVSADDFYRDSHQHLFRAIVSLHTRAVPIEIITLLEELKRQGTLDEVGGKRTILECMASISETGLKASACAQIVRDASLNRQLTELGAEMVDLASSQRLRPGQIFELVTSKMAEVEKLTGGADDEDVTLFGRPAPAPMAPDAFYGLAGEIIGLIDPQTEACREAVLAQFLLAFGNLIGKRAHWRIEATKHWCNLFLCIVGGSSMARKGTAWDAIAWLLERLDPEWMVRRVMSGQSTGAGLINKVRDPEYDDDGRETEKGVADKRALFIESEFGGTLSLMGKEGNDLSAVVRQAFDGKRLMLCPKFRPLTASNPHISIIGHITRDELQLRLNQTDRVNGYANRFLWLHAYRSKLLPRGGEFHDHLFAHAERELADCHHFATQLMDPDRPFRLDQEAGKLWDDELYARLTAPQPGAHGEVTRRGAPIVLRLAVIYAILDRCYQIRLPHLRAALAIWDYCDRTAACIFGGSPIDLDAAELIKAIRQCPDGMSRNQINRQVFSGHKRKEELTRILGALVQAGMIVPTKGKVQGLQRTLWKAL